MIEKLFKFSNGDEVKDKVTGFKGVITGIKITLTGGNKYLVTAKSKNGYSEPTELWYNEERLELLKASTFNKDSGSDRNIF